MHGFGLVKIVEQKKKKYVYKLAQSVTCEYDTFLLQFWNKQRFYKKKLTKLKYIKSIIIRTYTFLIILV